MKTIVIVMSVLSLLGIIFTLISGVWINYHESLISGMSNFFNFLRFQAINMVILTIIKLVLAIARA